MPLHQQSAGVCIHELREKQWTTSESHALMETTFRRPRNLQGSSRLGGYVASPLSALRRRSRNPAVTLCRALQSLVLWHGPSRLRSRSTPPKVEQACRTRRYRKFFHPIGLGLGYSPRHSQYDDRKRSGQPWFLQRATTTSHSVDSCEKDW